MSTKNVVRLFVGIHKLGGQLTESGALSDRLAKQIEQINETLGNRLRYLDVDLLKFLLKASPLSREGAESRSALLQEHMPVLQAKLMVELMGPIVRAVKDKAPVAVSSAVEAARQSLAELDQIADRVSNERDKELEAAIVKALGDKQFLGAAVELKQILLGKSLKMDKKGMPVFDLQRRPIVQNTPNAVSRALGRGLSGADAEKDRETANLMLLKNAVSWASRA